MRKDIYQRVTDSIVAELERGVRPWLLFSFRDRLEAGNVLLHAAGKGNNDVPAFPDFERFKVKGNLVSGFGHLRK